MIFLVMFLVMGLAAAVLLVVTMGIEGRGRQRHPELADRLARAAKHLNGDGKPPSRLERMLPH